MSGWVREALGRGEKGPGVRRAAFLGGSDSKESTCNAGDLDSIPGLGGIPWRKAQQPTLVLFPGESHGPRSLGGYSPGSHKELDMTEATKHSTAHSKGLPNL